MQIQNKKAPQREALLNQNSFNQMLNKPKPMGRGIDTQT